MIPNYFSQSSDKAMTLFSGNDQQRRGGFVLWFCPVFSSSFLSPTQATTAEIERFLSSSTAWLHLCNDL